MGRIIKRLLAKKKPKKAAPRRKAARKAAAKRRPRARRRAVSKAMAPAPAPSAPTVSAPPAAKARPAKAKPKKLKKAGPPKPPELPWRKPLEGETKLGVVEDYYAHIGVIVVKLERALKVGDSIHVHGHTTDFTQALESIQVEHQSVPQANPGDAVGLKVGEKCRKGDYVFLAAGAPAAGGLAKAAPAS